MSSNFLITSIDPTNKKSRNKIDFDPKILEKIFNKQQEIKKNKNFEVFQDKKHSTNLEKTYYEDSLILLKILEQNAQDNILKKYNIKDNFFLEKDSQKIINDNKKSYIVQDMLMKKKILNNFSPYFFNKKFFDFDILKITEDILETIKNTVVTTYETVKTETIDLFNGKTIKKLFFQDVKSDSNQESIESLKKNIEDLKKTIESSKIFIKAIIDKIRSQGKIKIINQLNNNPTHPEYQSSFPDLLNAPAKTHDNKNNFYSTTRFDENFDLEGRKNILKIDKTFKERMNKSVQESYYNNFVNHDLWQVSDQLNSLENISFTIKNFQKHYENLKLSNELDNQFMNDSHPFLFIINDNFINLNNRTQMIQDFQKIIPESNFQKLISTYANQKFLYQSYLQLVSENPEINEYQIKNSRNIYKIDQLDDGSIKLVATNLSDLDIKNNNNIAKYKSFGIRATVVIPLKDAPVMKYSHFLKK
ncbi:Putative uncharacterized protein Yba3 [Buchnera aphidicola (Brachycaudus tragopogonis)]